MRLTATALSFALSFIVGLSVAQAQTTNFPTNPMRFTDAVIAYEVLGLIGVREISVAEGTRHQVTDLECFEPVQPTTKDESYCLLQTFDGPIKFVEAGVLINALAGHGFDVVATTSTHNVRRAEKLDCIKRFERNPRLGRYKCELTVAPQ